MSAPAILRPAVKFLRSSKPLAISARPSIRSAAPPSANAWRRSYATPSGVKEMTVRDALNEAMAEEMEKNEKVFVLGEEVAQYNGA